MDGLRALREKCQNGGTGCERGGAYSIGREGLVAVCAPASSFEVVVLIVCINVHRRRAAHCQL